MQELSYCRLFSFSSSWGNPACRGFRNLASTMQAVIIGWQVVRKYIIAVSLLLSMPAFNHGKRTGEGRFSLSISECSRRSNQAQIHTLNIFQQVPRRKLILFPAQVTQCSQPCASTALKPTNRLGWEKWACSLANPIRITSNSSSRRY